MSVRKYFQNPYLNAVYVESYIVLIAAIFKIAARPNTPDNFFTPIAALSLFVLSAAITGYLFLSEPLQLHLDGYKKEAAVFFLKTVVMFALLTFIAFFITSQMKV